MKRYSIRYCSVPEYLTRDVDSPSIGDGNIIAGKLKKYLETIDNVFSLRDKCDGLYWKNGRHFDLIQVTIWEYNDSGNFMPIPEALESREQREEIQNICRGFMDIIQQETKELNNLKKR